MHSSAIDQGAEETLSHQGEKLLKVCETTCLELWLGGRKQVIVLEWALFKTLAMYAYILSTCVLF